MPFLFSCPHCGTKTEVEDRFSGRAGECVTCGKKIQLPRFVTSPDVDAPNGEAPGPVNQSRAKGRTSSAKLSAGVVLLMLLIGFGYLVIRFGGNAFRQIQSSQNRVASINNLQAVAKALDAYAEVHGAYPPAYTVDAQGIPMHSWRVLILPFLGEEELFANIDLDSSWNSITNQEFYYNAPRVYTHPNSTGPQGTSVYQLLVGNQGIFKGSTSIGPGQVIDSPRKTILVVEVNPSDFTRSWMEPSDIELDRLLVDSNAFWSEVEGLDPDGVMVATVDGRVHVMPQQTSLMTVDALFTPRGGEPLPDDVLESVIGTQ